jgi:hypothetical protein
VAGQIVASEGIAEAGTLHGQGAPGPFQRTEPLEAAKRPAGRAPWSMYLLFGALVLFAGRVPGPASDVLLLFLVVALCRPRMTVPRNAAAVFALLLLATVGIQVAFDALSPTRPAMSVAKNLSPVYHVLYAFLVYAGLRTWEQRASRAEILHRIEEAMVRWAPFVIVAMGVTAVAQIVKPAWLQSEPASALLGTPLDVMGATAVVVLPALCAAVARGRGLRTIAPIAVWLVTVVIIVFRSRSSMVALLVVLVLMARATQLARAVFVGAVLLLGLYVSGLSIDVETREISFDAVMSTITTVTSGDDASAAGTFVETRQWRSEWWADIWDRVFAERMILHGDGWSEHLGLRYDVEWFWGDTLTAPTQPHNILLSLVAHGGVVVGALFAAAVAATLIRAHRRRKLHPPSLALDGALAGAVVAFVAALMNPMLDVSLGAVLFWTLVGFLWWVSAPNPSVVTDRRPTSSNGENGTAPVKALAPRIGGNVVDQHERPN